MSVPLNINKGAELYRFMTPKCYPLSKVLLWMGGELFHLSFSMNQSLLWASIDWFIYCHNRIIPTFHFLRECC